MKENLTRQLVNETDSEKEEPQIQRSKMRQSLRIIEPLPQLEEKEVEEVEFEEENSSSSEHTSSEQPNSEEPPSEHPSF